MKLQWFEQNRSYETSVLYEGHGYAFCYSFEPTELVSINITSDNLKERYHWNKEFGWNKQPKSDILDRASIGEKLANDLRKKLESHE